jgi:hypothetical protein
MTDNSGVIGSTSPGLPGFTCTSSRPSNEEHSPQRDLDLFSVTSSMVTADTTCYRSCASDPAAPAVLARKIGPNIISELIAAFLIAQNR